MPLARIVTRFPERTLAASEYFRSQGYTVEIVSPGDFRVTPASLEITLGKCTPDEALLLARQALHAHESPATRPLAPAAQPEPSPGEGELAPTAFDITGRPVEFDIPAERRQAGNSFVAALTSVLQRGWNAMGSSLAGKPRKKRAAEPPSGAELVRRHQAAGSSRAEQEVQQRARAAAEERARLEHENQERERAASERAAQERERIEHEQRERAAAEERARIECEDQERTAREKAAREEQERQRAARERLAAEERERSERERRERTAAAEQERLKQEQQERERVAAIHEALIAAQRERERAQAEQEAVPIPTMAEANRPIEPATASRNALQRAIPPNLRAGRRLSFRAGGKSALIAAAAAVILILAGLVAYANRRPAAPLSNSDLVKSQSVQQQTPFGPATIPPPPAPPKPTPAVAPTAPARRTSAGTPSSHPSTKSRRAARRLRSSSPDDPVAEDEVVVRHFSKAAPVTASRAATGMKKYSDMN